MDFFSEKLFSLTVSGCGNNNYCRLSAGEETEFLSWYRPRRTGPLDIAIKYWNRIYSTGCGVREEAGPSFTVTEAAIGRGDKPSPRPEDEARLTFGGEPFAEVTEGFSSDLAPLTLCEGDWLSVRLRVRAETDCALPSTNESASSGFRNGLRTLNVLRPGFIGSQGDFRKTLLFFGDSITQGARTRTDKYEAWSHRVGLALPDDISVINNGCGWARAYDAEAGGIFLRLARRGDVVTVCFGVNDIKTGRRTGEQVITSLRRALELLREGRSDIKIILFTVPPFNLDQWEERQRQIVNRAILGGELCSEVFDLASLLEGESGRVRPEFMCASDDAHPNGAAGEAAARALLSSGLLDCLWK